MENQREQRGGQISVKERAFRSLHGLLWVKDGLKWP